MTKQTVNDELIQKTNNLVKEFVDLLAIDTTADVSYDDENEALVVDFPESEKAGLLIGNKGRTISSLQVILGMMLKNEVGDWHRVIVNIADWRDKEKSRLESLADQTAQRALETNKEQVLYNLTPSQRRIIHMVLAERDDVVTESRGEGEERYLVVSPK